MSAAATGNVSSFINTDSNRIKSTTQLKVLGIWFDNRPGVELHVEKLEKKFRSRLWALRHLKRSGMSSEDMLYLYKSLIRPVADFASVTYHTMLNQGQSDRLEKLQKRALKIVYGTSLTTEELLSVSGVNLLHDRREEMFLKFAMKVKDNERINKKWLPLASESVHDTRNKQTYKEITARTERLKNSPIFAMRRLLNRQLMN